VPAVGATDRRSYPEVFADGTPAVRGRVLGVGDEGWRYTGYRQFGFKAAGSSVQWV